MLLGADDGDHEHEQSQRRDRLDDAGDTEDELAEAFVASREDTQGHGDEDGGNQGQHDEGHVFAGAS